MGTGNNGNLPMGLVGGIIAAIVGAVLWAVVTVTTKYQIGFMAVGVGFLVGYAVRMLGKGSSNSFRIVGAACALGGCLLGNLLTACGLLASEQSAPLMSVTTSVLGNPGMAAQLMQATFNPMDFLFYGIAIYEGYKLSAVSAPVPAANST